MQVKISFQNETIVGSKKMAVYDDVAEHKVAIYDKGIEPRAVLGEGMDFDHPDFTQFNHRSGDVLLPKIHQSLNLLHN